MTRRIRIVIGVFLLLISVSLLIWSLAPMRREIRTQPIAPAELQLLAPSSLHLQPTPVS
jgi:hypothetical protein